MKNIILLLSLMMFILCFELYLEAKCSVPFYGPVSTLINKKEYVKAFVCHDPYDLGDVRCPVEEISIEGEDKSIKLKTNVYEDVTCKCVEIRPTTGDWGNRKKLEIPIEALCVYPPYSQIGYYVEVNVTDEESFKAEGIKPEIRGYKLKEPKDYGYTGDVSVYTADIYLSVYPGCKNCSYFTYIKSVNSEFTYYSFGNYEKDMTASVMIKVNDGIMYTSRNCTYTYKEKDICQGLEFRVQIKDGYGNLSEISEPYHFYPSDEYRNKYCMGVDGGTDVFITDDVRDNTVDSSKPEILRDSGGCNIIELR